MTDFAPAFARLQLAMDQSNDLKRGLGQRQGELLELEETAQNAMSGRFNNLVVIDQAEDVRRAIRRHADVQLSDVRDALTCSRAVLIQGLAQRSMPVDFGRLILRVVDRAVRDSQQATAALDSVATALGRTAEATPAQRGFAVTAREGIDSAASQLESARRCIFRVSEDLPTVTHAMTQLAAARDRPWIEYRTGGSWA
jgi:hypothetical protein